MPSAASDTVPATLPAKPVSMKVSWFPLWVSLPAPLSASASTALSEPEMVDDTPSTSGPSVATRSPAELRPWAVTSNRSLPAVTAVNTGLSLAP